LVLGVLHLDEPMQVLPICLLLKAGIFLARLFSVGHLGVEVVENGPLLVMFFDE
jgi:hypothetical protein